LNIFGTVKDSVITRQVAEMYKIQVRRNGMDCCSFYKDKNASMKIERFHCVSCQADGDVINFIS
jgi:DNA primase